MKKKTYKMINISDSKFFIEGLNMDNYLQTLRDNKIKYTLDTVLMTEEEYSQIELFKQHNG